MALDAGTQLGRYEIRSKIGAGGMGEVYLAQGTSELGRTVALKIISAEVAQDKDRLQRFTQEARTVSNLNHPNILTVHEFGQTESVSFIATEFVDGVTLRQHLSGRRLKLIDVLDVAIQIVGALNAAHEAGVTHRDLKPENVMVRTTTAERGFMSKVWLITPYRA
jgi:serine/threonine protein kinase